MTNEIQSYGEFNPSALLDSAKKNLEASAAGMTFLKFSKGEWLIGQEEDEVGKDDLFAVDPSSIQFGWIEWNDGQLGGKVLGSYDNPPSRSELQLKWPDENPHANDKYSVSQMVSVQMRGSIGLVQFETSSKGGVGCIEALIADIAEQAKSDPKHLVPLVFLERDSYKHSTFGKIWVPVLEVESWDDFMLSNTRKSSDISLLEADEEIEEIEEVEEVEEAPKRAKRRQRRTRK